MLIEHFFFFCIITNSLHPASNYLGIFFFLSWYKKVVQLPAMCLVCQCLASHPNFFAFQIVCLYLYRLLFAAWDVCLYLFADTFLSRGTGAPVETNKWAVLQRKHFSLRFCVLIFFFPGGLCFQFCLVWELNHPTLLLRTAFGFLTAAITKSVWMLWSMVQVERTEKSI